MRVAQPHHLDVEDELATRDHHTVARPGAWQAVTLDRVDAVQPGDVGSVVGRAHHVAFLVHRHVTRMQPPRRGAAALVDVGQLEHDPPVLGLHTLLQVPYGRVVRTFIASSDASGAGMVPRRRCAMRGSDEGDQ